MKEKKLSGRDVVCPYFLREESRCLSCEGWVNRTSIKWTFASREEKTRYMKKRCEKMDGYQRCLVAAVLERKYQRDDQ